MVSCSHFCPHDYCDSGDGCGKKPWVTRCVSAGADTGVVPKVWNLKYMNCSDNHGTGCYDDGCGAKSWVRCVSSSPRRETISRYSPITGKASKVSNFRFLGCSDGGCGQKSFLTQCVTGIPKRKANFQGASKMWKLKYDGGRDGGCGQKSWLARCVPGRSQHELNSRVSLLRFPLRRETQGSYRFP
jgi:hypothetical protein